MKSSSLTLQQKSANIHGGVNCMGAGMFQKSKSKISRNHRDAMHSGNSMSLPFEVC